MKFFFFFNFFNLSFNFFLTCKRLIYLWLCWVFVVAHRLSLVEVSGDYSLVVVHGLSCSSVYGIFPDQGSNLYPLHWQMDS